MDPISGAGPIKQAAVLLFYGWGYNFYRVENQLRADDLLIRAKVGGILANARGTLKNLEAEYRRVYLPPPSRDAPLPDRQRFDQVRMLERSGVAIEKIATAIQTAPTPASDFVWLRHRGERGLLEILQGIDVCLVDEAVAFHDRIVELDLAAISQPDFEHLLLSWLKPLQIICQERSERLTLVA